MEKEKNKKKKVVISNTMMENSLYSKYHSPIREICVRVMNTRDSVAKIINP